MARKKKELPLLERVTITGVAAEGKALARVNDLVVFVHLFFKLFYSVVHKLGIYHNTCNSSEKAPDNTC